VSGALLPKRFDVPTWDAVGRGRGIAVEPDALTWIVAEKRNRRPFAEIVSIALEFVTGDDDAARCDIVFADEALLAVLMDERQSDGPETYRTFVLTLIDRLGPEHRKRIVFRHGSRWSTRLYGAWICGFGLFAMLALVLWLLVSPEAQADSDWQWAIFMPIAGALFFAWGMRASLRERQTVFDPEAVPTKGLPPAPKQRAPG
jgi:hypothetical protein